MNLGKRQVKAEVSVRQEQKAVIEQAHQLNLSVNKYQVYKALEKAGNSPSLDEIKEQPISQLIRNHHASGKGSSQAQSLEELLNIADKGDKQDRKPVKSESSPAQEVISDDNEKDREDNSEGRVKKGQQDQEKGQENNPGVNKEGSTKQEVRPHIPVDPSVPDKVNELMENLNKGAGQQPNRRPDKMEGNESVEESVEEPGKPNRE
jgi:hypothetical protein